MVKKGGFTITELMVSIVIISVFIFGFVEAFKAIQHGIQNSKNRAIASNLAQEKLQIIKEKLYYKVVPTLNPSYLTDQDFDEPIPYDTIFFPPEYLLEAGVYYTRYTYIIPVIEVDGKIIEQPPNSPDTGMKKIVVSVVWQEKNRKKKLSLSTIYTSKDTVMTNATITGRIRDRSNYLPIKGALINIAEYMGARGVSDDTGNYAISLTPGNYTLYVDARGYFSHLEPFSIGPNQTIIKDIDLVKMGYGKITGIPWICNHLVISQIVGSTLSPSGFDQEYIEVYNPTTYPWLVNGNIGLRFQRIYDNTKKTIQISYLTDYIPQGGFYLFANTTTIIINGVSINADAVWSDENSTIDFPYFNPSLNKYNIIPVFGDGPDEGGGAVELYRISDNYTLDQIGWNRNDGASGRKLAPFYETLAIPQNIGLEVGEQYVRYSSTYSLSLSYGPSYDSNNNSVDFNTYQSINIPPRNSSTILPIISGTPADGAIVSCADGLSVATQAYKAGNLNSRWYAYFEVNEVATGSWRCSISSNSYALIFDTDVVVGSTVDLKSVFLSSYITSGYITGMVTDVYGNNITPAIKIEASDGSYSYVSNKRYIIQVSTGIIDITANPGNLNPSYVYISSTGINIGAGEIKSGVDFVLYQGGRITGKVVISGSTIPVPGVGVVVYDMYDTPKDNQITDNTGSFITNVLSTGIYIVSPVVDSKETVNPSTKSVTINAAGTIVFSATFSITNAMGYISGNVRFNGKPVKTGALIVITTRTITGSLPSLSSNTVSQSPYYITSTNEEGNYLIEVRHSTNPKYNVYGYYPHLSGDNFIIYASTKTNIAVWAGKITENVNFSW